MAGAVNLTEVDFDNIRDNLIDYLKSTKKFTDYDFDGSNLSVILNLISYQAQLNAYTTNMVANESFLSSSSIRKNVVANARQIGYVPVSARSASSVVSFEFDLKELGSLQEQYPGGLPQSLSLKPGFSFRAGTYNFNTIKPHSASVNSEGVAVFTNVRVYEGSYLRAEYTVDKSDYDQKFTIENRNVDARTISVEIQEDPNEDRVEFYRQANNLVEIDENSRVYWLEEIEANKYQLTFGDGFFGRALNDAAVINIEYVVSSGEEANGISKGYTFTSSVNDSFGTRINILPTVSESEISQGGADVESIDSVKFRAPKSYSSQNRCVTPQDYENMVRQVYPGIDDMFVYGGEELEIPAYGRVYIVVKPQGSDALSVSTKKYIKDTLKDYRVASLDLVFQDPDILYVEAETNVYYDDRRTSKDATEIATSVRESIQRFIDADIISRFGGAVRYSRIVGAIDDADDSITRNTTNLIMRKNIVIAENTNSTYECCFENEGTTDYENAILYSSGFIMDDTERIFYFENKPPELGETKSSVRLFYFNELNEKVIVDEEFGTLDIKTTELMLNETTIKSTSLGNSVIEVRAQPINSGRDIVAEKTVYLDFDMGSTQISAIIDRAATGS